MSKYLDYSKIGGKRVKVFISSTFHDMQSERDQLVKVVFPALRSRLQKYSIQLTDIDLRWGITEEEAKNGEILELCFENIDKCSLFISIIGDRYGTVWPEIPPQTLKNHPWLHEYPERSVTEFEIRYCWWSNQENSVNKKEAKSIFFYLRDPNSKHSISAGQGQFYIDKNIENLEKLDLLKLAIMNGDHDAYIYPATWNPDYQDVHLIHPGKFDQLEEFSNRVFFDLWLAIKNNFHLEDENTFQDAILEDMISQVQFMEGLLDRHVYRQAFEGSLMNRLIDPTYSLIAVTGEAGCGKSSMLAKLFYDYRKQYPQHICIPHFVGTSSDSANLSYMLKKFITIMSDINPTYQDQKASQENVLKLFQSFLKSLPEDKQILILIDGVDLFQEPAGATTLAWLDTNLPSNLTMVLSYLLKEGDHNQINRRLKKKKFEIIRIGDLKQKEKQEIITKIPSLASKNLDLGQKEELLANNFTSNALFLNIALEEMRTLGSPYQVSTFIKKISIPQTIQAHNPILSIFNIVLNNAGSYGEELVRDTLSYLACSRNGILESNLNYLLEDVDKNRNINLVLKKFRPYLMWNNSIVSFANGSLKETVEKLYLPTIYSKRKYHLKVASLYLNDNSMLLWHYLQIEDWDNIYWLLTDSSNLSEFLTEEKVNGLQKYWAELERRSDYRIIVAYKEIIDNPNTVTQGNISWTGNLFQLGNLLQNLGYTDEALKISSFLQRRYTNNSSKNQVRNLINHGIRLISNGQKKEGLELLIQAESLANEIPDLEGLEIVSNNLGKYYSDEGDFQKANEKFETAEYFAIQNNNPRGLSTILSNRAAIMMVLGNLDEALKYTEREEEICLLHDFKKELLHCLDLQSTIHVMKGRFSESLIIDEKIFSIGSDTGDLQSIARTYGRKGDILSAKGSYMEAISSYQQKLKLLRKINLSKAVAEVYVDIASVHGILGNLKEAEEWQQKALSIQQDKNWSFDYMNSLIGQAEIFMNTGRFSLARNAIEMAGKICRPMHYLDGLQRILGYKATLARYSRPPDYEAAIDYNKEKIAICKKIGNPRSEIIAIGNLANVYLSKQEFQEALPLLEEKVARTEKMGLIKSQLFAIGSLGPLLAHLGNPNEGLARLEEMEALSRKHSIQQTLIISLQNQGVILFQYMGNYRAAISKLEETLKVIDQTGLLPQNKNEINQMMEICRERMTKPSK